MLISTFRRFSSATTRERNGLRKGGPAHRALVGGPAGEAKKAEAAPYKPAATASTPAKPAAAAPAATATASAPAPAAATAAAAAAKPANAKLYFASGSVAMPADAIGKPGSVQRSNGTISTGVQIHNTGIARDSRGCIIPGDGSPGASKDSVEKVVQAIRRNKDRGGSILRIVVNGAC